MNHLGDTNKMVSETPRMDASAHDDGAIWQTGCDIERKLNAANAEIEEKRKDVVWLATEKAKLEDRIKRLEEALTEIELAMKQPATNHRLMQIAGPARQVINIIKKAKEDKL